MQARAARAKSERDCSQGVCVQELEEKVGKATQKARSDPWKEKRSSGCSHPKRLLEFILAWLGPLEKRSQILHPLSFLPL